jgi:hypothetical protein
MLVVAIRTRTRRKFKCWNDFDELTKIVNGKKVRYATHCKHCKQTLTARSTSGTGRAQFIPGRALLKHVPEHVGQHDLAQSFNKSCLARHYSYRAETCLYVSVRVARLDIIYRRRWALKLRSARSLCLYIYN